MKLLKTIINVILTLIIVIAIIIILLLLIGIKSYVALSGSMEPMIKTGSLCFINKNVDFEDIKEQDVIAYKMDNGTIVIHRVLEKNSEQLITKGDANELVDEGVVTKDNYIGKNIFIIPKIGYVVMMIQSKNGIIISLSIIILMLIGAFLFDDKKDNKEKNNEI